MNSIQTKDKSAQFSETEFRLLQNAVGIAEKSYSDLYEQAIKLANVRGNPDQNEQQNAANAYWKKASEFAMLNAKLSHP